MPARFFLLLLLSFPTLVYSQPLLMRAGANYNEIKGANEEMSGLHVGIAGRTPVNKAFFLQGELIYQRTGYKEGNIKTRYNYLLMPFSIQYQPKEVALSGGFQVGCLLDAHTKDLDDKSLDYLNGRINTFDLSFFAGVSVPVSNGVYIDLRLIHGLTNTTVQTPYTDEHTLNIAFLFSVLFPISK